MGTLKWFLLFIIFYNCSSKNNYDSISNLLAVENSSSSFDSSNFTNILTKSQDCELIIYPDEDKDGFGKAQEGSRYNNITGKQGFCTTHIQYKLFFSDNFADNNLDCNDSNSLVNPNAMENTKDSIDNDCDTLIDEGISVSSKSMTIGSSQFDFTDGAYIDSTTCSNFDSKIYIYASKYERNFILTNLNLGRIQLIDTDINSIISSELLTNSTSKFVNDDTNNLLSFTYKPLNFCDIIKYNKNLRSIRFVYIIKNQEGDYQDSYIINNTEALLYGSYSESVPLPTNYNQIQSKVVNVIAMPLLFTDLSSATTDLVKEVFKRSYIKTGTSSSDAKSSTNYDDVKVEIKPNSSSNSFSINFSSNGIYKSDPCNEYLYINKPKFNFNFKLRIPTEGEALVSKTKANLGAVNIDYYDYNPPTSNCGGSSVKSVISQFSDINSDTNKNYKAKSNQLAVDVYSIYFTLNSKQPTVESDLDGSANIFNDLVDIGSFSDNMFDYPGEQLLAAASLGLYKNDLLYRLRKNDLEYNSSNMGASFQESFRNMYSKMFQNSKYALDIQRFYTTHTAGSGTTTQAGGDLAGAIQYLANSYLTNIVGSIDLSIDISDDIWNVALEKIYFVSTALGMDFKAGIIGSLPGNKQKLIPQPSGGYVSQYNYVVNTTNDTLFSINFKTLQQIISSMIRNGMWNVQNIIEFSNDLIIDGIEENIVSISVKNLKFGGDYKFNGQSLKQYYRIDANARLKVNNSTPTNISNFLTNYFGTSFSNTLTVGIEVNADMNDEDVTYIAADQPESAYKDHATLVKIATEAVFYELHSLACMKFGDNDDGTTSGGWNYLVPIDFDGSWSEKNNGMELTYENYCSNILNGYVKKYLVYYSMPNSLVPQILAPQLVKGSNYYDKRAQLDFAFDLKMFTPEQILGEVKDDGGSYGGTTGCNDQDTGIEDSGRCTGYRTTSEFKKFWNWISFF